MPAGEVPGDDSLLADLKLLVECLDRAQAGGLTFEGETEPIHLLFKWASDREPDTINLHLRVAGQRGSVWWGKFGTGSMSEAKLSQLQQQLADGVSTSVFLYGGGSVYRAALQTITTDPSDVDEARMAGYYGKDECSLFVRLADFAELDTDWALEHLLLASDPEPGRTQGALGNQTTPLFVFERRSVQAPRSSSRRSQPLTMEWLEERSLWTRQNLEELLESLSTPPGGKGQVILAGLPAPVRRG